MKILIVIPARGKSKGIPRKNIRIMNGNPLISYGIKTALAVREIYDTDVVVDTDDEEIAEISLHYGAEVVMRPDELAGDLVTLDPVIFHAVQQCEMNKHRMYDMVITMQPTSPTLRADTLEKAIKSFVNQSVDTMISVVNEPHLSWKISDGQIVPEYERRVNRQLLPEHYKETGGFLITRREYVREESRFGKKIAVFEVPYQEAIDIDNDLDWKLCETIMKSKKILLRADGEEELGMGHIYRCLSIAYHLTGHDILFVTKRNCVLGAKRLQESFFKVCEIDDEQDIFSIIEQFQPDIVVNDILNTEKEYMSVLKKVVPRVINFEDKGSGAEYADCVINALYEEEGKNGLYSGFEYFFIRDEFLEAVPKKFQEEVRNIVVLYGGSDPSNLTQKTYTIFKEISKRFPQIEFHIITGFGYKHKNDIVNDLEHKIYIHNDVKRVSKYLQNADLALTSQGRTIYELACMGVPAIVLAQNRRETEHIFANIVNGFINLGIGKEQNLEDIRYTIEWLIKAPNVRRQMHELLLSKDFKKGQERVIKLILGEEV